MNDKIKTLLLKAYYIGGSPCSGKSSVSEALAKKYCFEHYRIDDYENQHANAADPVKQPTMYRMSKMSWEQIWMRPVDIQVKEEFEYYRERFQMILEELNRFPPDSTVLMEGAALLPELLDKLGIDKRRVIYMVPSKEFQVRQYSKRDFIKRILSQCSNPEKAFENWMERDYLFGKEVVQQAQQSGYKVVAVDGRRSLEENVLAVLEYFGLAK